MNVSGITNSQSLTPYLYSSSSDEEHGLEITPEVETACELDDTELNTLITSEISLSKKKFENSKMLSLQQAKNLLTKIQDKVVVHHLSAHNLLYVEMAKILKEMSLDIEIASYKETVFVQMTTGGAQKIPLEGKTLVQQLSIEIHYIFANFRRYSMLFNGETDPKKVKEKLLSALSHYSEIVRIFGLLKDICAAGRLVTGGNLCLKLKQQLDIIYHLCHCEQFLVTSLESLSPDLNINDSVLENPPKIASLNYYFKSLDAQLYALDLFKIALKKDYSDPIHKQIDELKKINGIADLGLEQLLTDIQNFLTTLSCIDLVPLLEKMGGDAKTHKNNELLRSYFQKFDFNTNNNFLYVEMDPFIYDLCVPWESLCFNFDSLLKKYCTEVTQANTQVNKSINNIKTKLNQKKGLKKVVKNKTINFLNAIATLTSSDKYSYSLNALVVDPMRNPQFSVTEMGQFTKILVYFKEKFLSFSNNLLTSIPNTNPCSSFNALDILVHRIFKYAAKHSEQKHDSGPLLELYHAVPLISNSFTVLQCDSIISRQNYNKDKILFNLIETFNILSESLSQSAEDPALKMTLQSLTNFLSGYNSSSIPYLLHLLLTPLNSEKKIDAGNIILIKDFFSFLTISSGITFDHIVAQLNILEIEIKKKINDISEKRRFFWTVNFKAITLLRHHVKALNKAIDKHNPGFIEATNPDEIIVQLHKWDNELSRINKLTGHFTDSVNILCLVAKKENLWEIEMPLLEICDWRGIFDFFNNTLVDLKFTHPLPIKVKDTPSPIKIENQAEINWDSDLEADLEEEPIDLNSPEILAAPEQVHIESLYTSQIDLVSKLKLQTLKPLSDKETPESYFFRVIKRQETLKNITLYLALLEEELLWNESAHDVPELLKARQQIDLLLLLEATEKIALCTLRLGSAENSNNHIASASIGKNPLLYTHDGEMFVKYLHLAGNNWLSAKELAPVLQNQKIQLKKTYWFKEDPTKLCGTSHIRSACEEVLQNIACLPFSAAPLTLQAKEYQKTNTCLHKLNRKQLSLTLPLVTIDVDTFKLKFDQLISSFKCDPKCEKSFQIYTTALKRVFNMHTSLSNYTKTEQMPLFFCMRSAEIQVSLLSLAMQIILSTYQVDSDQTHPLFLDHAQQNIGRPLIHTHKVDKLYQILKEKMGHAINQETLGLLDEFIPLFVGDPRYPYPNKTLLTDDLVKMHHKVHLLQKLREGGFLSEKEQKMLKRYIGKEGRSQSLDTQTAILRNSIMAMIKKQQQKTAFAFYLVEKLLNLNNNEAMKI